MNTMNTIQAKPGIKPADSSLAAMLHRLLPLVTVLLRTAANNRAAGLAPTTGGLQLPRHYRHFFIPHGKDFHKMSLFIYFYADLYIEKSRFLCIFSAMHNFLALNQGEML